MKILAISNVFPPGFIGGYELGAFEILNDLSHKGHSVRVLTTNYFGDPLANGEIDVNRCLDCSVFSHLPRERDFIRECYYNHLNIGIISSEIKKYNPDVVLCFNLYGLGPVGILKFLEFIKVPYVVYLMDNFFAGINANPYLSNFFNKYFGSLAFLKHSFVISMSTRLSEEVGSTINSKLENVTYVPGWVDISTFKKSKINLSEENFRKFVFSSRIAEHKGVSILLEAVKKLRDLGYKNFIVDVFGNGDVSNLINRILNENLIDHIHYMGCLPKDAMKDMLTNYDALVFPTWERETFGFIVTEAATAGALPILTAGTGASEWFIHERDSLKIQRTPESLATAMRFVMEMDTQDLIKFRRRTFKESRRTFSSSNWFSVIESTLERCTEKREFSLNNVFLKQVEASFMNLARISKLYKPF